MTMAFSPTGRVLLKNIFFATDFSAVSVPAPAPGEKRAGTVINSGRANPTADEAGAHRRYFGSRRAG